MQTQLQPWFCRFDNQDDFMIPEPEFLVIQQERVVSNQTLAAVGEHPDDEEAEALFCTYDAAGKRSYTEAAARVEKKLIGEAIYNHIFSCKPLAKTGRHNKLASLIGKLVDEFFSYGWTTEEDIKLCYALIRQVTKLLDRDESWTGPTWEAEAWEMINSFWRRTADQEAAKALEPKAPKVPKPKKEKTPSTPGAPAAEEEEDIDEDGELTLDKNGTPYPVRNNFRIALHLLGIKVWHNEFSGEDMVAGVESEGLGPRINDIAELRMRAILEDNLKFASISVEKWNEFLRIEAWRNRRHPVREYFDALKWDGVKRLESLLTRYFGAEDTELHREFSRLHMVAAVRRVRHPGAQFDEVLLLEGQQGSLKSSGIRTLCPSKEWFLDDLPLNLDAKEVIEQTRGKMFVELAEMAGLRKAQIDKVKALISRRSDTARLAYGRRVDTVERQFVFWGSTNDSEYLADQTGNRRFWPVEIGRVDIAAIAIDRDQLWAEAATYEAQEMSIRLEAKFYAIEAEVQAERTAEDPIHAKLEHWLQQQSKGRSDIAVKTDTLWKVFNIPLDRLQGEIVNRVGNSMKRLGFKKRKYLVKGAKAHFYIAGDPFKAIVIGNGAEHPLKSDHQLAIKHAAKLGLIQ